MSWFKDVFNNEKAIIASMYLPPLPGSPDYKKGTSLDEIINYTHNELVNLQEGGMDGVSIGNQQDWPYRVGVGHETSSLATRIISEAMQGLSIPFGITIFWDDISAISIAKATGAMFVRGVFRGSYVGEFGMLNLNAAEPLRYRMEIDAENIKLVFLLRPVYATPTVDRGLIAEVKDCVFVSKPDGFALCGPIPGEAPTLDELQVVRDNSKGRPILMNNGATPENISEVLKYCDGAVVATHLRKDHKPSNPFNRERVKEFMDKVNENR